MKSRKGVIVLAALTILLLIIGHTQFTLFVVQPIGAIPDGRTLLIWRREKTQFIDSADAFCEREVGKVSLFCRGTIIGAIATGGDGIIARLPYSKTLYLISTGGEEYDR